MKKIKIWSIMLLVMMILLVVSCGQNNKTENMSQTEKNVIEFARQHVSKIVQDKEATIDGIDTLLYDDSPYLSDEKWDSVITSYKKGRTTEKELSDYISNKTQNVADVHASWRRTIYDNNQLKGKKEYENYWHKVYRVSFGGSTIRIIMDSSGETPIETEDDFCKRMNNKKVNMTPEGTPMYGF